MEDLYKDENRGGADVGHLSDEVHTISGKEFEAMIKDLPKGKACASDKLITSPQNCCKAWGIEVWR